MKVETLKLGILGFGQFAEEAILPAIRRSPFLELVAIQKRHLDQAKARAAQYAIPFAYDSEEALLSNSEVEAVFVTSANNQHLPQTKKAAQHGKPVLCEKPMALTVGEAEEMIAVCKANGVPLMIAHMLRFSESVRQLKKMVTSGELGTVRFVRSDFSIDASNSPRTWLADPAVAGGGPVMDIGVHALDTIRFILGREVEDVAAFLDRPLTSNQIEQEAEIGLRFSGGILGVIQTSFRLPFQAFVELKGTRGTAILMNYTQNLGTAQFVFIDPDFTERRLLMPNGDFYRAELEAFARAVQTGEPVPVPGEEGLKNQIVLDRVYGK